MKRLAFPAFVTFALISILPIAGCKPRSHLTPDEQEQEVQRRVAQKLAEEKVAQQAAALDQKAQDIAARERDVAAREQSASQPTQPANVSGQDLASSGSPVDDQVGGTPSGSYDLFYNTLASEGDWFDAPSYGLVWRPAVAARNPGWRPYTVGHWGYSEDVGWTWVSDESFGWATYHYGRWTRLAGAGWVWIPGTQWGPAWVSWRKGDDYVGWAPLPPESRLRDGVPIGDTVDDEYKIPPSSYAFVPFASLGDEELYRDMVAPEQNVTIINNTVNITEIRVNRTVVVNKGPAIVIVRGRVRHPVDIVKVVRDPGAVLHHPPKGVVVMPGSIFPRYPDHAQKPVVGERLPQAVADRGAIPTAPTPGTPAVTGQPRRFPPGAPLSTAQTRQLPPRAVSPWNAQAPQGSGTVVQSPSQAVEPVRTLPRQLPPPRSTSWNAQTPPGSHTVVQSPSQPAGPVPTAPPRYLTPPPHQAVPTPWPTPAQAVKVMTPEQPRRVVQEPPPVPHTPVPMQPQRLAPPIERPIPVEPRPRVEAPVRERVPEPARSQPAEHSKGDTASPTPKDKSIR